MGRKTTRIAASGIGARLRELRTKHGLTQRQLAHRAGISPASISQIESGDTPNPGLETITAIESALGQKLRPDLPDAPGPATEGGIDSSLSMFRDSRLGKKAAPTDAEIAELRQVMVGFLDHSGWHPLFWASLLTRVRAKRISGADMFDPAEAALSLGRVVPDDLLRGAAADAIRDASDMLPRLTEFMPEWRSFETREARTEHIAAVQQRALEQQRYLLAYLTELAALSNKTPNDERNIEIMSEFAEVIGRVAHIVKANSTQ